MRSRLAAPSRLWSDALASRESYRSANSRSVVRELVQFLASEVSVPSDPFWKSQLNMRPDNLSIGCECDFGIRQFQLAHLPQC